jgi:hypothetical protein
LDRLYMSVGNGDVIEVGHPSSKNEDDDPRWVENKDYEFIDLTFFVTFYNV